MDVDKVERNLLALYKKMVGPGVWPAGHVIEWDAFLLIIKACVFEFWSPTEEEGWVWRKKGWVDDEATGKVREMREEDEKSLIAEKVRLLLEKAAGMEALKARYSKEAQTAFDDLVRYVNGWHVAEQVGAHQATVEDKFAPMALKLAKLKRLA